MAGSVTPQVDIGTLSLGGLGAFAPILATLSADDVAPMALIQMDNLGTAFRISGPHAAKVPDLLQRFSSTRLDRLGIAIGWRKGDTASFMGKTPGGQVMALFSCCLTQLFNEEGVGRILKGLSERLLEDYTWVASVSQLSKVATLLAQKLHVLGFGNFLALQVTRLHTIYEKLGKKMPSEFLDIITVDSTIELFQALSRANSSKEAVVVRITGTRGIGYIMAIMLMMFPDETLVTVENVIVHEGSRRKFAVECKELKELAGSLVIVTGTVIQGREVSKSILQTTSTSGEGLLSGISFTWSAWVADLLNVELAEVGLKCSDDLLVVCCNILGSTIYNLGRNGHANLKRQPVDCTPWPYRGLLTLLGPHPYGRIRSTFETVFAVSPTKLESTLDDAYQALTTAFLDEFASCTVCSCSAGDITEGWDVPMKADQPCALHRAWHAIGMTLNRGFWSVFIHAKTDVTVTPRMYEYHILASRGLLITQYLNAKLFGHTKSEFESCEALHIFMMISDEHGALANCFGLTTIYSSLLDTMELDPGQGLCYRLVEGSLVFNNHYYKTLQCRGIELRPIAKGDSSTFEDQVTPSSAGKHEDLELAIREHMHHVSLQANVRYSGIISQLNFSNILISSYGHDVTTPCQHDSKSPLKEAYKDYVMTTSVAAPLAEGKLAIVQTQRDRTAQLLAFEKGARAIVMKYCCLNCAYEQAKDKYDMIIVT